MISTLQHLFLTSLTRRVPCDEYIVPLISLIKRSKGNPKRKANKLKPKKKKKKMDQEKRKKAISNTQSMWYELPGVSGLCGW